MTKQQMIEKRNSLYKDINKFTQYIENLKQMESAEKRNKVIRKEVEAIDKIIKLIEHMEKLGYKLQDYEKGKTVFNKGLHFDNVKDLKMFLTKYHTDSV